jgi:S1-C subfamily serine protease
MNGSRFAHRVAVLVAALVLVAADVGRATAEESPQAAIARASRAVVKVYGAGGVRGLEGYQTGVLVSPEGRIVTVMSTVLDSDDIDCVLDDGSRHRGTLVGVDPYRELAVLTIEGGDFPALVVEEGLEASPVGTRVIALSNLFGVALGDERVSAQRGVVAARVPLEARRGAAEAPFNGEVYLLDFTTNNPGSPGGALIDSGGRLVGMLGKELRATSTGVWLNYALPVTEVACGIRAILEGSGPPTPLADSRPFDPRWFGLWLVPDLLDRTPPFVEAVVAGSAAATAGLRPDDLLVAVGGRSVATRGAVQQELGRLAAGDPVKITVIRDGTLFVCDLGPRPRGEEAPQP